MARCATWEDDSAAAAAAGKDALGAGNLAHFRNEIWLAAKSDSPRDFFSEIGTCDSLLFLSEMKWAKGGKISVLETSQICFAAKLNRIVQGFSIERLTAATVYFCQKWNETNTWFCCRSLFISWYTCASCALSTHKPYRRRTRTAVNAAPCVSKLGCDLKSHKSLNYWGHRTVYQQNSTDSHKNSIVLSTSAFVWQNTLETEQLETEQAIKIANCELKNWNENQQEINTNLSDPQVFVFDNKQNCIMHLDWHLRRWASSFTKQTRKRHKFTPCLELLVPVQFHHPTFSRISTHKL